MLFKTITREEKQEVFRWIREELLQTDEEKVEWYEYNHYGVFQRNTQTFFTVQAYNTSVDVTFYVDENRDGKLIQTFDNEMKKEIKQSFLHASKKRFEDIEELKQYFLERKPVTIFVLPGKRKLN